MGLLQEKMKDHMCEDFEKYSDLAEGRQLQMRKVLKYSNTFNSRTYSKVKQNTYKLQGKKCKQLNR